MDKIGTSFGLNLVKEIVRKHEGKIKVKWIKGVFLKLYYLLEIKLHTIFKKHQNTHQK